MAEIVSSSESRGRCRCGRYQFRISSQPFLISYCHCSDCRSSTGAPVTVFVGFEAGEVRLVGEDADAYQSTPDVRRLFCARCGTPIGYKDRRLPGEIYYYLGMFEEQSGFSPQLHAWVSERLEWLEIVDDLPQHAHFSRPR